jgi:hypothetical protein
MKYKTVFKSVYCHDENRRKGRIKTENFKIRLTLYCRYWEVTGTVRYSSRQNQIPT